MILMQIGAGLRMMFPFGPIRVEYAFVLNPKSGARKDARRKSTPVTIDASPVRAPSATPEADSM